MATKKSKRTFSRNAHEPNVKSAFLKATRDARKAGKPWTAAFGAARRAGYKGTLAGIEILVRKANGAARSGRGKAAHALKKTARVPKKTGPVAEGKGSSVDKRIQVVLANAARQLRNLAQQLERIR